MECSFFDLQKLIKLAFSVSCIYFKSSRFYYTKLLPKHFSEMNSKTGTFQLNWHFFLSFLGIAQVILTDIKGNFIYLFLIFIAYVYFKILGWFHMKLTQAHRLPTWLSWILLGPYIHQERKIQKISSNLKFFRAALSIVLALP